jgi:hypothetical protein
MNMFQGRLPLLSALAASALLAACGGGGSSDGGTPAGGGGSGGGGGTTPPPQATSHNPGQNCLSCHRSGGAASSRIFTVAGTVYKNDGSAQTNASVVLYPDGSNTAQATISTDGAGNFYTAQAVASLVPAAGQQFALGARVVVRVGSNSRSMPGVITNGSCNQCHSPGGGTGRVVAQTVPQPGVTAAAAVGNGESLSAATPRSLAQIAVGLAHSCTVKTDGAALCWGSNDQGQLGNFSSDDAASAITVSALAHTRISSADQSIAAGNHHTCAVTTGSNVLCWGANDSGQLGNGTTSATPVSAVALSGVTALNAAGDSTCARLGSGAAASFYCWGASLGSTPQYVDVNGANLPDAVIALLGTGVAAPDASVTRNVAGLEAVSFAQLASSSTHSCGITTDDRVKCWDASNASVDVPVP